MILSNIEIVYAILIGVLVISNTMLILLTSELKKRVTDMIARQLKAGGEQQATANLAKFHKKQIEQIYAILDSNTAKIKAIENKPSSSKKKVTKKKITKKKVKNKSA